MPAGFLTFFPGYNLISHLFFSSVTSDDAHSVDFGFRVDIEEKGFYTENFHSTAWVFRGDDGNPEDSPRCLSKKPRPVAGKDLQITARCICLRKLIATVSDIKKKKNRKLIVRASKVDIPEY